MLTLSRPGGGTLCPPHRYHIVSPKRLGVWSSCLVNFLPMYILFRKVQFCQSALMYVAMATMQLFGLFLKTQNSIVFQVFPPERNFLWDNFLCFGHQNSRRSSFKANIRSVIMETFQKIILPKYGHRHWNNWLVPCFTVYNQQFTPQESSEGFFHGFLLYFQLIQVIWTLFLLQNWLWRFRR